MSAKNVAASVLYDNPGPRARRNIAIGSVIFLLVAGVGVYLGVYRLLADAGQFEWILWAPLLDPTTVEFPQVWEQLGKGWVNTLTAAGMAIAASLLLGTGLAVLRARVSKASGPATLITSPVNAVTRVFVEVFRGLPVILTIFFVARGLPEFGISLEPRYFLVIGLTLYNMVVIGEILRSGMANLPRGQQEAADALGLSRLQTIRLILLPQAFRIMLPALISQVVVVLKDTTLGGLILAYEEVLGTAKFLIQNLSNPIQMYLVIAVLYIVLNYLISRFAVYVQKRLARGRKTPKGAAVADVNAPGGPGADAPAGAGGAAG